MEDRDLAFVRGSADHDLDCDSEDHGSAFARDWEGRDLASVRDWEDRDLVHGSEDHGLASVRDSADHDLGDLADHGSGDLEVRDSVSVLHSAYGLASVHVTANHDSAILHHPAARDPVPRFPRHLRMEGYGPVCLRGTDAVRRGPGGCPRDRAACRVRAGGRGGRGPGARPSWGDPTVCSLRGCTGPTCRRRSLRGKIQKIDAVFIV